MELMVVIAITAILMALLFPGLSIARETALKLKCSSNMRQLGTGITLYSTDHNGKKPRSLMQKYERPFDQMAITVMEKFDDDGNNDPSPERFILDGLGLLVGGDMGCYCDSTECLFCPSHNNNHTQERYQVTLDKTRYHLTFDEQAWSNYQYLGTNSTEGNPTTIRLGATDLLVTDGFRTQADFNHQGGMNQLRGDCSIQWESDPGDRFRLGLPQQPLSSAEAQSQWFQGELQDFLFGNNN